MAVRVEHIGDATRVAAIYALCDDAAGLHPRYVGKTIQYLHERHKAHIRAARRGGRLPVHYWIRKKLAAREFLVIKLLQYAKDDWAEHERYWIDTLRTGGARLLNLTSGGEGLAGHRFAGSEHAARIAAALRKGSLFACEVCGNRFWRKPHEIKSGHNRFCSRSCSNGRGRGPRLFDV